MSISRVQYINTEERMIADMLEETKFLKQSLEPLEKRRKTLTHQEKKLLLLELKDIENIVIVDNRTDVRLDFHFKPISLFLDNCSHNDSSFDLMEEQKKPFYHLWRVGFIDFKTSKFVVTLLQGIGNHRYLSFSSRYEDEFKTNPHDRRMNCWGGWYNVIEQLFKEKKFYDAIINLASRMKQITINDGAASLEKLREFRYEVKDHVLLNDQEADYFKTSIKWLRNRRILLQANNTRRETTEVEFISRDFMKCQDSNNYYLDITFRGDIFKLEISELAYREIIST